MSHYARTIKELTAQTVATKEPVTLPIDTEIRNVMIVENTYRFEAHVTITDIKRPVHGWLVLETEEDFPSFTDKGLAHRERKVAATLRPGRPPSGEDSTAIAVRVSVAQRAWVNKKAERKGLSLSDYLRGLLEAEGMPS